MNKEYSAGAVVFRQSPQGPLFVLLETPERNIPPFEPYSDFPKGHLESGEIPKDAAIREIREETGITELNFLPGFEEKIYYEFVQDGEPIGKQVIFFCAETPTEKVAITHPHLSYVWADFDEALKLVRHENARAVLKKAAAFIDQQKEG